MSILQKRFALLLLLAILFQSLTSQLWGTTAPQAAPITNASFGPALGLLTVQPQPDLSSLAPGIQLHTQIQTAQRTYLVVSGDLVQLQGPTAAFPVQLLDADTRGKRYYFADATHPVARQLAAEVGQILYADAQQLLIAIPAGQEETLLTRLPTQGVQIALLSPESLVLPADADLTLRAGFAHADTPDPLIVSLLEQLTEAELSTLIGELSGESAVDIGGNLITINTRYTLSTRIRDVERYLHQYYTNLGLNVSYFEWVNGSFSGRNVVAEIPGVLHPERIWFVGGHFDSISENPANSAPGADDNGSGTAATLLIAKILRTQQFADTVRFIHFSGEEQGQWGSKAYARELTLQGAQVMGYLDLDMIGWDSNGDRVVELHAGTGPKSNELATAFTSANQRYTQGLVIERKTTDASRFSDHSPFWDNNFGAFLAIENFFDGEYPRDRNPWYHNTGDKLARVNLNYIARYGRTALATLAELAGIQPVDPNATPTPTDTVTPTPSPTFTATPLPTGCTNLLLNGDFESSGGWTFGSTPYPAAIVNTVSHAGANALRLGILPEVTNRAAHSSAYQQVVLPASADHLFLRYWQRPGGAGDGVDYRETLLLNSDYNLLATLERNSAAAPGDLWSERIVEVTAYRGKTVVFYFNVYNNGSNSQVWNYVDEVALLVCSGEPSTATPTPTATATATITGTPATPTPSQTPTLLPTAPPDMTLTPQAYLPFVQR